MSCQHHIARISSNIGDYVTKIQNCLWIVVGVVVAHFGLSHIYIKFAKLWKKRHQSRKKKTRSIKQKWIMLICSIHKNFYRSLFFVFDSLQCLQQLIWKNRPVYPLILHPWKPKATSPHRKIEFLCAKPLCKYRIGQLSSSQGISYGKPSGAAHSSSRVTMSFSCNETCRLFFIFHFVRCTTFLNNNAKIIRNNPCSTQWKLL